MVYFEDFQVTAKVERLDGDLVVRLPKQLVEYLYISEGDSLAIAKARNSTAEVWKDGWYGAVKHKV